MAAHTIDIDFSEPIPIMIERLKKEHRNFELDLNNIQANLIVQQDYNDDNKEEAFQEIINSLNKLANPIIKHAVEEEARIMRVIMQGARDQSAESISIMQEHNYVLEFFKVKLDKLMKENEGTNKKDARKKIQEFIQNLKKHFIEEEETVFPLALKADSLLHY